MKKVIAMSSARKAKQIAIYSAAMCLVGCWLPTQVRTPAKVETTSAASQVQLSPVQLPPGVDLTSPDWRGIDITPKSPVLAKSVQDEAKTFVLQPGYKMEPVLTEPQIEQPAAIAFDGNGRMYVLELRSYMLDADAKNELEPTNIISRWEDKNNDGVYETGAVFVEGLVFPRFILPYGANSILSMESNTDNVYKYTDTNNDGKSDKKELFVTRFGRSGNVEHQQSSLFWGMDNWLYSTYNAFRVRWDGTGRETTGSNGAQWGISQDNDGKVWFQGGASGVPSYFQFPLHYGRFTVEDQLAKDFTIPYGMPVGTADFQGGMDEVRLPDASLARVTGSAGNEIFRGTRLPASMVGQYFYGEPVARVVRQVDPVVSEGITQLHNVYQGQKTEFIKSSDPLFRPIDMQTAPDGTMYIVDMYRGIIQEGQWTQKTSYLRTKIDQFQLDKVISKGRIWRLTYQGMDRDKTQPRMLNETATELVAQLENPNGWWRDMAQQLIILKGDKSVVPMLEQMARTNKNVLARFHALWTLEGLGVLDAGLLRALMRDPNPRVQIQAIRASETIYKGGDKTLATEYNTFIKSANPDIVIQAMLTINTLKVAGVNATVSAAIASNKARGVQLVGSQILTPPVQTGSGNAAAQYTASETSLLERGALIFNELCSQCHGETGTGKQLMPGVLMAPSFVSNPRVQGHSDYLLKALLKGLTGPIEGKSYAGGVMVAMGDNPDEWVASITSYLRNNFTNAASFVSAEDVAKMRKRIEGQKTTYKYDELLPSIPKLLPNINQWKATASHNKNAVVGGTGSPSGAFNFEGWTTGVQQTPGMFFQIELPSMYNLVALEFNSPGFRGNTIPGAPGAPPAGPQPPGAASGGVTARPTLSTAPRGYILQGSKDGKTWFNIAEGKGSGTLTFISFAAVETKFLKMTQTQANQDSAPWTMQALKIYEAAK